uniref:Methyltransferase FkbM domain-containing protein n=1 Tax=viral metagenome TaxID=1070528 RepID=A0A6C0JHA9_9ZZZZ
MDPTHLTVYQSPFRKHRIGQYADGGYVICDIPDVEYDILIAGGVDNNVAFEEHFCQIYDNTLCFAYDGTIENIETKNKNITFFKQNISHNGEDGTTTLHHLLDAASCVFIKMDIEGWEIPWLLSLTEEHFSKIGQIVMEFHRPFDELGGEALRRLSLFFSLVHFHPNNCCGCREHSGVIIPNVFECTFINKKYIKGEPILNTDPVPSDLDVQNLHYHDEIHVNYPPFRHEP